jgi:hypothetical protein
MTEAEAKAVEAIKEWSKILMIGWNDVSLAKTLSLSEEFFSAVGLDFRKWSDDFAEEMRKELTPKQYTEEELKAMDEETLREFNEVFGDLKEAPGPTRL